MVGATTERRQGELFAPLLALSVLAVGIAILLAVSPLNEMPDTYCQTALSAPADGSCAAVTDRRWQWIAVVGAIAVALFVLAIVARRRGAVPVPILSGGLFVVALVLALSGAAFLTVGLDHDDCGSTLSRVDEYGSYNPSRPADCRSTYSSSRIDAALLGTAAGVALLAGTVVVARRPSARAASTAV